MSHTVTIPAPPAPSRAAAGPIDTAVVEDCVRQLLRALGQDVDRPGLLETPARVARFWAEFLGHEPGATGTVFEHTVQGEDCVAVGGIRTASMCEHHLLPFTVEVSVAYRPDGQVLGLSKIVRIVEQHAHALQLQERLTAQVAEEVARLTGSQAVAVWAVGEHQCMTVRGVRAHGARTATEYLLPALARDALLAERLRRAAEMTGAGR
ncbi:GTP cyclohydrolase I FolE [Kitasatospora sp. NPDC005856]|uniref:GTP cyclohydrolase I n=1 Tax=Kitasatospora sp. NPDC005856 TaxID=3154566 RepID=UPI0033DA54C4